ncbi:uncharacterized protein LOC131008606 isoform X2 [Salvia miltiorrhiza]|uniref:uncharacterized protein LOC131008606 isoform X2 n=1 Tax=Salvia miltiorrhiza TaxID=226208 RepID=UPI0025ACB337|nr:uncharacterized protein LOC131008606 isoform X2 [Salvia miltiorrhiza]
MASTPCTNLYSNNNTLCTNRSIFVVGLLTCPFQEPRTRPAQLFCKERICSQNFSHGLSPCLKRSSFSSMSKKLISTIPRCSGSSNSSGDKDETSNSEKTPFGYSRKDVILIGVGLTAAGIGLKSGLEYIGVDPLQAGNVVQLVLVLGLTIGWISTYIFRVSNKEMTYAQQLRDYEDKVMQKRLETLTEAEIEALLEQVEEEKQRLAGGEQVK